MTQLKTRSYGTFKYPSFLSKNEDLIIGNIYYVIEPYNTSGLAVHISIEEEIKHQFYDFDGNSLDPSDSKQYKIIESFLRSKTYNALLDLIVTIRLFDAVFYFSINEENKFILVDVKLSENKFCSPGMIKDVFGKCVDYFRVISVEQITDEKLKNFSEYINGVILKPSSFKLDGVTNSPLYFKI